MASTNRSIYSNNIDKKKNQIIYAGSIMKNDTDPANNNQHQQQLYDREDGLELIPFKNSFVVDNTKEEDDNDDDKNKNKNKEYDRNDSISTNNKEECIPITVTIPVATKATLCLCMFIHSYLLISVFPYSPFMAIALLNNNNNNNNNHHQNGTIQLINEDSAGTYAGLLASAFMIGRATTSFYWGKQADKYGRLYVLYQSLFWSSIFSCIFGFITRSYLVALMIRFLLGCSNGIMGTIKTIVSELNSNSNSYNSYNTTTNSTLQSTVKSIINNTVSGSTTTTTTTTTSTTSDVDDETTKQAKKKTKSDETRLMSLVMGMWGWGFLMAPAFAGLVSEPVKQYYNNYNYNNNSTNTSTSYTSNSTLSSSSSSSTSSSSLLSSWLEPNTWIGYFLRRFPFVLPNLTGTFLCLVGIMMVYWFVPETLPQSIYIQNNNSSSYKTYKTNQTFVFHNNIISFRWIRTLYNKYINFNQKQQYKYEQIQHKSSDLHNADMDDDDYENKKEEEEDDTAAESDKLLASTSTNHMGDNDDSLTIRRQDDIVDTNKNILVNGNSSAYSSSNNREVAVGSGGSGGGASVGPPTMSYLMSKANTRSCLFIYWSYSLVNVAMDEIVPLFLISTTAGFGVNEMQVGKLLSACGIIFAIGQYSVCVALYDRYGTYGSIRIGIVWLAPMVCLIPSSLVLNRYFTNNSDTMTSIVTTTKPNLHWVTFWFLAIVLSVYKLMALVFFTNISVACNYTVSANERATMNGLSVLGGSIAKGLGPTFAGILTTQSVMYLHQYASILMFGVITFLSACVAIGVFVILQPNDTNVTTTTTTTSTDNDNMISPKKKAVVV